MRLRILALTLALLGCGRPSLPPPGPPEPAAPSAAPTVTPSAAPATAHPEPAAPSDCAGSVEAPDGLKEVEDRDLLGRALAEPGRGGLCTGKVFEVVRPISVFRVWNIARLDTALGLWWSFTKPKGPVEAYRVANAFCPEWSELNYSNECHLKVGARIVVGPAQSASCKKGSYEKSAQNKVFIPNDTRDKEHRKLYVDGCTSGAAWP